MVRRLEIFVRVALTVMLSLALSAALAARPHSDVPAAHRTAPAIQARVGLPAQSNALPGHSAHVEVAPAPFLERVPMFASWRGVLRTRAAHRDAWTVLSVPITFIGVRIRRHIPRMGDADPPWCIRLV